MSLSAPWVDSKDERTRMHYRSLIIIATYKDLQFTNIQSRHTDKSIQILLAEIDGTYLIQSGFSSKV